MCCIRLSESRNEGGILGNVELGVGIGVEQDPQQALFSASVHVRPCPPFAEFGTVAPEMGGFGRSGSSVNEVYVHERVIASVIEAIGMHTDVDGLCLCARRSSRRSH